MVSRGALNFLHFVSLPLSSFGLSILRCVQILSLAKLTHLLDYNFFVFGRFWVTVDYFGTHCDAGSMAVDSCGMRFAQRYRILTSLLLP